MADPSELPSAAPKQRDERTQNAAPFAIAAVVIAVLVVVGVGILAVGGLGGDSDDEATGGQASAGQATATTSAPATIDDPELIDDPALIVEAAADAMAAVTGAEFTVVRTGAPVFADPSELLQIEGADGQFAAPSRVQATLDVKINGTVDTQVAAISIDDTVWLSNPLTGDFEVLPDDFSIDLGRIFDPDEGWRPLLTNLTDLELVSSDGEYHVRGVAPAEQVENFTVGLISGQSIPVDFRIDQTTSLVTAVELTAAVRDGDATWTVELDDFGAEFVIEAPDVDG